MTQLAIHSLGAVSSRACLDAPAILAVKVGRIAGASRLSRLETEPIHPHTIVDPQPDALIHSFRTFVQ